MNEQQLPSQDYASSITIGKGKFYVKIGTVYIGSMETLPSEKVAKIKEDYGIDIVTEEEWEEAHSPKVEEASDD